jgi:O-antigen/teichoic acid export membrane protein
LVVGVGLVVWNLGNWVFFILVGRLLGPINYGLVAAILSACLVAFVICGGLQPALAAANEGRPPDRIFARALRVTTVATVASMAAAAGLVLVIWRVAPHIPVGPLLTSVLVLTGVALFPLTLGQLQAEGRFGAYALGFSAVGLSRPLVLLGLWAAGMTLLAPILGTAVSLVVGAAVVLVAARRAVRTLPIPRDDPHWDRFRRGIAPNAAGITAIAVLTNADVITARLVLHGRSAGLFAAASAIGQGLFLVPQVYTTLVLPRIARRTSRGVGSASLAAIGVAATLACGLVFALLALPLGVCVMRLTYGRPFGGAGRVLPYYAGAMAFMGCVIVLLYQQLGRRDFRYSWWLLGVAGVQVLALATIARSTGAIIVVDFACAVIAIGIHEVLARPTGERLIDGLRRRAQSRQPAAEPSGRTAQ